MQDVFPGKETTSLDNSVDLVVSSVSSRNFLADLLSFYLSFGKHLLILFCEYLAGTSLNSLSRYFFLFSFTIFI